MKIYGVVFKDNGKIYNFQTDQEITLNANVIADTDKGLQYAKIVCEITNYDDLDKTELKEIIRVASDKDREIYINNLKLSEEALITCRKLVNDLKLNMNVINSQFNFDKSQLLFNFVSDERVDFRDLVKKLAAIYHTRIELRQIGARDKAKEIGGVGICGQKICCKRFLNKMDCVTMNMAKNQNLALNPSKINGVCGRLLCCLNYEDEMYVECSKNIPNIGDVVETENGKGTVIGIDILNRKLKVLINDNKEEIELAKIYEKKSKK